MDSAVVVAIISGIATVLAVILTNASSNRKVVSKIQENQAIMETKYGERLKHVEKDMAKIPELDQKVQALTTGFAVHDEQIKTMQKMIGGKAHVQ